MHIPVLLNEVIEFFKNIQGFVIDATLGYAGHTKALLDSNPNIKVIANDQDIEAINYSKEKLKDYKDRVIFSQGNFSSVIDKFKNYNIQGILADIGVSSLQLDKKERGFSFESDILDMRMDQSQTFSAYDVVNYYSQKDLEELFFKYDVKNYKKVAYKIIQNRPINSAKELAKLFDKKNSKIHPATIIFQAIRIEVNKELYVLEKLLDGIEIIKPKIVAIITFHSLEDKIVKNRFKKWSKSCICQDGVFRCECGNNHQKGIILTKKPIVASKEEIKQNPRSRSAKLRVFSFKENN